VRAKRSIPFAAHLFKRRAFKKSALFNKKPKARRRVTEHFWPKVLKALLAKALKAPTQRWRKNFNFCAKIKINFAPRIEQQFKNNF